MSANYFYQIVHCSQRPGRVFRREIAVSSNSAMVTNIEVLPPGYDMLLERARQHDERVYRFSGDLRTLRNYKGCPFCGNSVIFECTIGRRGCGALSCISADNGGHHCCPACDVVHEAAETDEFLVSGSGFVDQDVRGAHRLDGGGNHNHPPLPGPSPVRWRHGEVIDVKAEPWRPRPELVVRPDAHTLQRQEAVRRLLSGGGPQSGQSRLPGVPPPRLLGDGRDRDDQGEPDRETPTLKDFLRQAGHKGPWDK